MNDNIKYVISDKEWDGTFDEASSFLVTNLLVYSILCMCIALTLSPYVLNKSMHT